MACGTGIGVPAVGRSRLARWLGCPLFVLGVVACAGDAGPTGPAGPQGPDGPAGPAGTPAISVVTPSQLFWERVDTVLLSGSGTNWTANTTVDFGPGTTVHEMTVASPAALVAMVSADSTAELGPRSITVVTGADTLRLGSVFQVRSPIELELVGSRMSGGLLRGVAYLRDPERPFRLSVDPVDLAYSYLAETGTVGGVAPAGRDTSGVRIFLPIDAPLGDVHIALREEWDGVTSTWRAAPVEIGAPDIVTVDLGGSVGRTITELHGSSLQAFVVRAGQAVSVTSTGAVSTHLVYPDSAAFDEGPFNTLYVQEDATWFARSYDFGGDAPLDFTLTVDTMTVAPVELGATPVSGSLSSLFLHDFYTVDVAAGDSLTVSITNGPTDVCGGGIDAALVVRNSAGYIVRSELGGCPSITTEVAATETYSVSVNPHLLCACTFDYTIGAVKN
ncbi:MAG: hypothetical protein AAF389_04565 [Gemmatimonadota bacterium]